MSKQSKQPKRSSPGDTPALPERKQEQEPGFPVVGVGASAGGLEAFSLLLQHLPPDTGMAFVLVQHLHPGYASALTEILARETSMPVFEAVDKQRVEPNHLYVIPPNAHLTISRGKLQLLPRPQERRHALPIDQFFRTLAEEQGSRAIGVILSGNASDGVLGLKAIKGMGGITFAQEEETCKYPGMPHSVIASGCADFVLSPPRIAQELVRIARHPYLAGVSLQQYQALPGYSEDHFNKIFFLLRRYSGNDFTYYKRSTLERRIRRRMLMRHFEQVKDYIPYLQTHPAEIEALFHDLLINVTSFFRDPRVFEVLKEKAFPTFAEHSPAEPIRIWVPGCATGEEVYSLAIALLEFLGEKAPSLTIQIFATDIDPQAIDKARLGIYPENIIQDVSAERLSHFFHKVEGGYRISKPLRDLCVFALQNVLKDPPFSKVDLISCRNLLIYLGSILQKKAMALFHYALQPGGFLLLGSAENIGSHTNLFKAVDSAARLYGKKAARTPLQVDFIPPAGVGPGRPSQGAHPRSSAPPQAPFNLQKEVERVLLKDYTPAGVVFNKELTILQFHGRTGAFIEPAPGEASLNLLKMARTALQTEILTLIKRAVKEETTLRKEAIYFKTNGQPRILNLEVTPLRKPESGERHFLLLFEDVTRFLASLKQAPPSPRENAPDSRYHAAVNELEQELTATKEYLQSVIEQQETTNEELRSANEEIQSSNEELQSINEELETAKEELQSTNEELATVNEELDHRNQDLKQVNDDLNNMLSSSRLPIVIVDRDLRLQRFTPPAHTLLNLIDSDIGRPLSDINPNLQFPDLARRIREVVEQMRPQQVEAQDQDGHWYTARIQPYQTEDNKIDGAVIAFINTHPFKEGLDLATQTRDFAEAIVAAIPLPVLVLDKDQRVVLANPAYLHTFQVQADEITDNLVYYLGNSQWANPALRRQLKALLEKDLPFDDLRITPEFEEIGKKTFSLSGRRLVGLKGQPMILLQITEIRAK